MRFPARKLLVLGVSTLLSLVVANALLARLWPVGLPLFRLDEELLHTTLPGAERALVMELDGGRLVRTRIGSRGFRGPDPAPVKRRPRVAVYGDSLVLAENVERHETFVERLGVHLAELGRPAEMVNAGVTGYGPDQALLKLERELTELEPDLVVFVLCAHNDHGDLARNKLFRLDEQGALVDGEPRISAELALRFREDLAKSRRPALLRAWNDWRLRRERRAAEPAHYTSWYLEASSAEYEQYASGRDRQVYSLFHDYYDLAIASRPTSEVAQVEGRLLAAVLRRMRASCAARGAPLLGIVVPSAVDLVEDFGVRIDPVLAPGHDPRALAAAGARALEQAAVPYLDLDAAFRAAEPSSLFVGGNDFHWNAAGQDLGARLCARELDRRGYPPEVE